MREFEFINWISETCGDQDIPLGIGDDCAILPKPKNAQLFASDSVLEGTHFTDMAEPKEIGHKAAAVCLSDIAAMGGRPTGALINLLLPKSMQEEKVKEVMLGILATFKKWDTPICGGDTTAWDGGLGISISVVGEALKEPILRSGALAGDSIWISGPLGHSLQSGHHIRFQPRLDLVWKLLAKADINAMIDISDGLSQDLGHILKSSKVGALIDAAAIPLRSGATIQDALSDGEDFELCFTANPALDKAIQPLGCTRIGEIQPEQGIRFKGGEDFSLKGFEHITFS